MVTFFLWILGIIGYVVVGVIVHIALVKFLEYRRFDHFDVTVISGFTSIFWIIGLPITIGILFLCYFVKFVYELIEDLTDRITGN